MWTDSLESWDASYIIGELRLFFRFFYELRYKISFDCKIRFYLLLEWKGGLGFNSNQNWWPREEVVNEIFTENPLQIDWMLSEFSSSESVDASVLLFSFLLSTHTHNPNRKFIEMFNHIECDECELNDENTTVKASSGKKRRKLHQLRPKWICLNEHYIHSTYFSHFRHLTVVGNKSICYSKDPKFCNLSNKSIISFYISLLRENTFSVVKVERRREEMMEFYFKSDYSFSHDAESSYERMNKKNPQLFENLPIISLVGLRARYEQKQPIDARLKAMQPIYKHGCHRTERYTWKATHFTLIPR